MPKPAFDPENPNAVLVQKVTRDAPKLAEVAAGTFPDAFSLLAKLAAIGHHFRHVGIGGYPEGHGHIGAELIERIRPAKSY